MNTLVLGGTGMLGHKIFQVLQERIPDTWCTVRGSVRDSWLGEAELFQRGNVLEHLEASNLGAVEKLLRRQRPKTVVNCIGIIKQRPQAADPISSMSINALLPHKLAEICRQWDGRVIHFSTDCVFNGNRGDYSEEDVGDATDLYGTTKFLGEVSGPNSLTLRTSMIGRELSGSRSLLEWFLGCNHSQVKGYTRAFYSGVTTNYLAEVVARIIEDFPALTGLYQVTSSTISKFNLLRLLADAYGMQVEILPDDTYFCDRSMRGNKFIAATGLHCPSWLTLATQLAQDITPYEEWRTYAHASV